MHMAGKTDEARADLARLALIRKQREDAAKKREEEKKGTVRRCFKYFGLFYNHRCDRCRLV